jgi:glycosyltransferase involved in cell wall biosynthesis
LRILVVTSDVPFVEGGHRVIARSLVAAFREHGHSCEEYFTPQNRFGRQFSAYLATALTDVGMDGLGRKIDMVVSLRFPAYAVRHENHVCWLTHRMREYYDLWAHFSSNLSFPGRCKETVRRALIRAVDRYLLKRNVRRLYVLSRTVQARLEQWGRIRSKVLYPPPPQRSYRTEAYENFIFCPSRLEPLKRPDLLIDAFSRVQDKELKCIIAGDGSMRDAMERKIREKGLDGRVRISGFLGEKELIDHYARCLAVFFGPYHEDYGFVAPEAFVCRKPVVTCEDSGGPAETVEDGVSGFICSPDPAEIAGKLDLLASRTGLAGKMGERGRLRVAALSWEGVVRTFLSAGGEAGAKA